MIRNTWCIIFIALAWMVVTSHADVAFNVTALSSPRVGFSAIEAASRVYFIGGFEHGDLRATSTIEVYDLMSKNMSSPLQLDSPRAFVTPVIIEPNIYLVGGLQYINPTVGWDRTTRQFINYGTGPTVVNIQRVELHDSLLAVIGTSGVDILDVVSGNWTDPVPLRTLLDGMAQCAIFSKEGLVIVLGGVNAATGVYSSSAWVYDMASGEMHEYADLVQTPFTALINATGSFASNGIVAIQTTNGVDDTVLLYHTVRRSWKRIATKATLVLSLPEVTFTFNSTACFTTYWNSTDGEPVVEVFGTDLKHAFMIDSTVVQLVRVSVGATMEFRIYNSTTDTWVPSMTTPVLEVRRSVSLNAGWQVMATLNAVYGYSPSLNQLHQVVDPDIQPFGVIANLIPAEEPDQVYIFDFSGKVTKTQFFDGGITNIIKQEPCAIIPGVRIGSDFLNTQGQMITASNWTHLIEHDLPPFSLTLPATNQDHFLLSSPLDTNKAKVNHFRVDIYNYITNEWKFIDMPAEFVNMDYPVQWFYSAAALDNKLVVWMNNVTGVYNPSTGTWTTYTNYLQSNVNNEMSSFLHLPVPTAQGLAFMRTSNNTFDVFSSNSLPSWKSTSPAPIVEDSIKYVFQQCLVHNDNRLYVTGRAIAPPGRPDLFNLLFIYDISTDEWSYEQLPGSLNSVPTIALAGDYLLSMNDGVLSYRDLIGGGADAQVLDFTFSPAVVLETSANVTLIAGGIQAANAYVDRIMIIPHTSISISPPVSNSTVLEPTASGLSEAGLIAVIVVPIGVALIATALLMFFLVRRQKRRKQGSSTTIGLANQYGQWFIPFESIKFGDQLGQGASGQVFKGTWSSTTVALKVSMTQANSTVIGELELMMQIRPHPNVIQLFGFSVHPETDSIILVIEYCNGGSLDDTLFEPKQPISMQQKLLWLLGMAKGLEHLHSNNIVHRDIAARNVLLHQNEPKITDFGMSRLIDQATQRGTTKSELGPIRWMAPESLRNKEYSNMSDIWSFGVLMFEVVAQVEPHMEGDPIEIGRLIRDYGVTPTIPSSCPPKLAQLVKECWHMSPDKRISIDQLVLQLEAIQNNVIE